MLFDQIARNKRKTWLLLLVFFLLLGLVGYGVGYLWLGSGFGGLILAPVRKPGKLPRKVISVDYEKEYGVDTLCMHADAIKPGQRVLIVDDLLATGGTVKATIEMIERLGGVVAGCAFLIELDGLNGREAIEGYDAKVLMNFPG